ncbi:MAG: hypothetical protein NTV87_00090 [Ignavibacteriae bacterium]|nr:hypothetical protein [Ignavibacteriota bacterium]
MLLKSRIFTILMLFVVVSGCSMPDYYMKKSKAAVIGNIVKNESPIKTFEVKDCVSVVDDLDKLKGGTEKVDIKLNKGITIDDLIGLLTDHGISVVLKVQKTDEMGHRGGEKEKKGVYIRPVYQGTIVGLLRAVQDSVGVFYRVNNGTLTILDTSQVFIKIIYSGQVTQIEGVLKAFGVQGAKYDAIMNRVVFQSDYEMYRKVRDYFYSSPLSVAEINIVVLENTVSKNSSIGIDWSQLAGVFDELSTVSNYVKVLGGSSGAFTVSGNIGKTVSMSGVLSSIETFKNFDIIQNCNLSVANGENGSIDVSQKYPYVSAISISSLSGNSTSTVQSTTFDSADAGLIISVSPIIDERLVSVNVQMKYQSIVEYMTVGTVGQMVSRPVVSTRNVKTIASLMAGDVISVGSLRYKESSSLSSGLFGMSKVGLLTDSERWLEMTVLMGVTLKRYVLK